MSSVLDLPQIDDAPAFHLKRWKEVCSDSTLHQRAERVETNRYGQIVMMPPPGFQHSRMQFQIAHALRRHLPKGDVLTECAILTEDGIKGVDAAWISSDRLKLSLKDDVLTVAPEICVEVISPGNTRQEMESKRDLYFRAGAEEVWLCDRQGTLHFFTKSSPAAEGRSTLCPQMEAQPKS